MSTFTATPQPLNDPPRIMLSVTYTGGTGIPTSITVSRRNADGTTYLVRSANPAAMTGGVWVGYDYESPFAQAGVYTVTPNTTIGALTASVPKLREFGIVTPWLIHPGVPALSMPITVAQPGPVPVSDINQGVFQVLGRQNPVIRTDGVRRAPTFTLTVKTQSWDEEDALKAILADASTLLVQITYPEWERGDYYWVSVSTVTPARAVDFYGNTVTNWALTCTATGAPFGLLQAEWTYAGLLAAYPSYASVLSSFATYTDVQINNPIPV